MFTQMTTTAIALLLLLAACSSKDDRVAMVPEPEPEAEEPADPTPGARVLAQLAATHAPAILSQAAVTSGSLPNFQANSVTQASVRDSAGVTRDAAQAVFDGENLAVTINRGDAPANELDSMQHSIAAVGPEPSVIPGRTLQTWTLFEQSATPTLSQYRIHWDDSDPTDYLAAGYWLHLADLTTDPAEVEIGVFVGGSELAGTPVVPDMGTATYAGPAYGYYVGLYGTNIHPAVAALGIVPGSVEFGSFNAEVELSADFATASIAGCIGCEGGVRFSTLVVDGATGTQSPIDNIARDYQIYLDPAAITGNGTFRTDGVRVETSEATIARSGGNWGGKFSTVLDGAEPRLAAGTAVGSFQTDDGGTASFIGTLIGVKE